MLVCNIMGEFNTSSAPTLNGKLGIGFFSAIKPDIKGTLDIDQLASHDTTSTTTTTTAQTSILVLINPYSELQSFNFHN